MSDIKPITMPKWGLAMEEGTVTQWAVNEGDTIAEGQEMVDIETSKIANIYESPVGGTLRRRVAQDGDVLPVGALLAVVADDDVSDAEIDAFIEDFNARFGAQAHGSDDLAPDVIDIEGGRITYLKAGPEEGEPVVFVHGFGSDHKTWILNQMVIAETYPTYALDLPGHGASYKDADDYSAAALARTVGLFLKELGLSKVHLVGHSLGGAVSTLVGATYPELVKSITLIAPAGLGPEISGSFLDGFINETRAKKLRPFIEMLVADSKMITGEMVEDVLKFKRLDGAQDALQAVRAENFPGSSQKISIRDELAGLEIPVQIIIGKIDHVIPARQSENIENCIFIELADAGHIAHLEKSAEVNDYIKSFISDNAET